MQPANYSHEVLHSLTETFKSLKNFDLNSKYDSSSKTFRAEGYWESFTERVFTGKATQRRHELLEIQNQYMAAMQSLVNDLLDNKQIPEKGLLTKDIESLTAAVNESLDELAKFKESFTQHPQGTLAYNREELKKTLDTFNQTVKAQTITTKKIFDSKFPKIALKEDFVPLPRFQRPLPQARAAKTQSKISQDVASPSPQPPKEKEELASAPAIKPSEEEKPTPIPTKAADAVISETKTTFTEIVAAYHHAFFRGQLAFEGKEGYNPLEPAMRAKLAAGITGFIRKAKSGQAKEELEQAIAEYVAAKNKYLEVEDLLKNSRQQEKPKAIPNPILAGGLPPPPPPGGPMGPPPPPPPGGKAAVPGAAAPKPKWKEKMNAEVEIKPATQKLADALKLESNYKNNCESLINLLIFNQDDLHKKVLDQTKPAGHSSQEDVKKLDETLGALQKNYLEDLQTIASSKDSPRTKTGNVASEEKKQDPKIERKLKEVNSLLSKLDENEELIKSRGSIEESSKTKNQKIAEMNTLAEKKPLPKEDAENIKKLDEEIKKLDETIKGAKEKLSKLIAEFEKNKTRAIAELKRILKSDADSVDNLKNEAAKYMSDLAEGKIVLS